MQDPKPLTADEIAQLEGQWDRLRAMLAEIDGELLDVQVAMAQALADLGQARIRVDQLRNHKDVLVERARNLKTLLAGF